MVQTPCKFVMQEVLRKLRYALCIRELLPFEGFKSHGEDSRILILNVNILLHCYYGKIKSLHGLLRAKCDILK